MDYVEAPVLISRIVKWILSFMGLFLAGMIIYGGVLWISAGGNSEQISKARKTIIQTRAVIPDRKRNMLGSF